MCNPVQVESEVIRACVCTADLCNGMVRSEVIEESKELNGETHLLDSNTKATKLPSGETLRKQTTSISIENRIVPIKSHVETKISSSTSTSTEGPGTNNQPTQARTTNILTKPSLTKTGQIRSRSDRVKCHQCGNLFSALASKPTCDTFNPSDPEQQDFCQPGEACLLYSWQQPGLSKSVTRECLSTSVLLGSINDPLVAQTFCEPTDISEDSEAKVTACLCESDLCNLGDFQKSDKSFNEIVQINNNPTDNDEYNQLERTKEEKQGDTFSSPITKRKDLNSQVQNMGSQSSAIRSRPYRVKCHQCGSLFSSLSSSSSCDTFNSSTSPQEE